MLRTRGVGLVEVVVAIAIIAVVLGLATGITALSLRAASKAKINIQMTLLAEEGIEGVRAVREAQGETAFFSTPQNSTHCINVSALYVPELLMHPSPGCSGIVLPTGFTRTIKVENASVDTNNNLDGGTAGINQSLRRVTVTVNGPDGSTKTLVTVLAKIK